MTDDGCGENSTWTKLLEGFSRLPFSISMPERTTCSQR